MKLFTRIIKHLKPVYSGEGILSQIKNADPVIYEKDGVTKCATPIEANHGFTLKDLEDVLQSLKKSKKIKPLSFICGKKGVIQIELKTLKKLGYTKKQLRKAERRMQRTYKNCLYECDGIFIKELKNT